MIGFYDYTVILTYLSLLSGTTGIMLCLNGVGHPYLGMFFLLFSGLCDTFDGKVARTKKNRTEQMKKFGIQIDSLSDLVAFGVLPACIGISLLRYAIHIPGLSGFTCYILSNYQKPATYILTFVAVLYVLAALIFPAVLLLHLLLRADLTLLYFGVMIVTGFLFLFRFHIKKPQNRGIAILIIFGAIEFIILILALLHIKR